MATTITEVGTEYFEIKLDQARLFNTHIRRTDTGWELREEDEQNWTPIRNIENARKHIDRVSEVLEFQDSRGMLRGKVLVLRASFALELWAAGVITMSHFVVAATPSPLYIDLPHFTFGKVTVPVRVWIRPPQVYGRGIRSAMRPATEMPPE